jgi:predicted anti-sigma-YlaC factor YlaD
LVFAMTGVIAGRDSSPIHDSQHLGAFGAAIAAAVLFAAWRPHRARGLMPVALALAIAIPLFAVIDLANDSLTTGGGIHHIVQMIGLALVWVVSSHPAAAVSRGRAPDRDEPASSARPVASVRSPL